MGWKGFDVDEEQMRILTGVGYYKTDHQMSISVSHIPPYFCFLPYFVSALSASNM